jgi:hypothetical protein
MVKRWLYSVCTSCLCVLCVRLWQFRIWPCHEFQIIYLVHNMGICPATGVFHISHLESLYAESRSPTLLMEEPSLVWLWCEVGNQTPSSSFSLMSKDNVILTYPQIDHMCLIYAHLLCSEQASYWKTVAPPDCVTHILLDCPHYGEAHRLC